MRFFSATALLAFSLLFLPAFSPAFVPYLKARKDGELEEDEEDEVGKGEEDRLEHLEGAGCDRVLAREVSPGRALLQQRSCWLGEQFEHRLLDRVQIQNLHEPELLPPQHFGIVEFRSRALL